MLSVTQSVVGGPASLVGHRESQGPEIDFVERRKETVK